jgi:hypothetical protein
MGQHTCQASYVPAIWSRNLHPGVSFEAHLWDIQKPLNLIVTKVVIGQ